VETCRGCSRNGEENAAQRLEHCSSSHTQYGEAPHLPGRAVSTPGLAVGEVGNRNRGASPGFREMSRPAGGVAAAAGPSWGCPAFRSDHDPRSRYSVHGTPPRRFDGHAVFRGSPSDAEAPEAPIGLGSPSGLTDKSPPESCAAPATLMRFAAPTATSAREVHYSRDSCPGSFRLQGFSPS
jgi:hypothetical protein